MMDLTPALIAAFASLAAAGIAATVSLVVTVLAKEQKTSEFRQQWIDALRSELAELVAEVTMLNASLARMEAWHKREAKAGRDVSTKFEEFIYKHYENALRGETSLSSIRLRLNPKDHAGLLDALQTLDDCVFQTESSFDVVEPLLKQVLVEARVVIFREWARVQRGEPAFYWTKRAAISIVAAAVGAIGALAYRAL